MDATMMPMLCGRTDSLDGYAGDPRWVAEPKIDGWRAIMWREVPGVDNNVVVYGGRNGKVYTGKVPYIEEHLLDVIPPDTVLDGELAGVGGWGTVQGVMTRGQGAHVPSAAIPALTYIVWDVLRVAGQDARSLPWDSRRELLEKIAFDGQTVCLNPYGPVDVATCELMIARGMEGVVLKRRDGRYVNSRSTMWVKYKPKVGTDEARVVGFKPGEKGGRFDNMVGAFEVEMLDSGAKTTVKCGDDARHQDATDHPEKWLNTIIEISHHGLGKTGVPRHPQFHRRRDDMAAPAPSKEDKKMATKTPREKQVARALRDMPDRKTQVQRFATGRSQATGRMRNYGAMGDGKLLGCIAELAAGVGDAYNRALNASGNPEADLEIARAEAERRGL